MNDELNGIIILVCLGAIYYHWIKFELKTQFEEQLKEVEEKLKLATQATSEEPLSSKARIHLNEANAGMREIKEFDWANTGVLDDLVAVRRQLYFVNRDTDDAIKLSRKTKIVEPASASQMCFLA